MKDIAKTVVVTGGAQGIGSAIVGRLLREFAHVVVIDLEPAPSWATADEEDLSVVRGSAADEAVVAEAVAAVPDDLPLVAWVNNAAVFRDVDLLTASVEQFCTAVQANLDPVVAGSAAAIRAFRSAGTPGAVVNLSSHQAVRAVPGAAAYATAKAAIEGFTRAMAVDHGPHGIRVNAVAPGSIRTERHDAYLASLSEPEAAHVTDEIAGAHPLGRIGTAGEVADAVAFLLSPAAGFISGVTLPVDGGRTVLARDPEAR